MDSFYTTEEFNWLKTNSRQYVPSTVLTGVAYSDIKVMEDHLQDAMMYEINAHVLGKKLPEFSVTETKIFNTPKNPWQHFKDMYADKWFMRWIVQRWPVKFIRQKLELTASWEQWAVYPWIDQVPVTPNWQPVRIMMPAKKRLTAADLEIE